MDVAEKVRRQYTAMMTGDVGLAVAATAQEWINDEAADEPPACALPGPAGLLASGAWLRFAFSDLAFAEQSFVASADQVMSVVVMSGRHTGPMVVFSDGKPVQVIPPTGRRFSVRQAHVHQLRGDDIVRHAAVRDDLGLLTQLGAFPPSAPGAIRLAGWSLSGRSGRAGRDVAQAAAAAAAQVS